MLNLVLETLEQQLYETSQYVLRAKGRSRKDIVIPSAF